MSYGRTNLRSTTWQAHGQRAIHILSTRLFLTKAIKNTLADRCEVTPMAKGS